MKRLTAFKRLKAVQLLLSLYKIRMIRLLIPILFIVFIYWESRNKIQQINLSLTLHHLEDLAFWRMLVIFFFCLFAVSVMVGYDLLIRHRFKMKVPFLHLFQYAWIANSFNNFLSFAGFTGAGIRTILYKKQQVPVNTMIVANVFLTPLLIVGLSVMSWLAIIGLFPVGRMLGNHSWLVPELWGMALYLIFFLLIQRSPVFSKWIKRGGQHEPISWKITSVSAAISFAEWLLAGLAFWVVSLQLTTGLSVYAALGIYTAAATAGLISLAPGGLGSFDLTVLVGMEAWGVASPKAAAVLVLFRLFYYIVPWLIGLGLTVKEVVPSRAQMNDWTSPILQGSLNRWQKFWSWPGQFRFLSDLGVAALAILVFLSGLLLLLSAATPGLLYRLKLTAHLLSLPVMDLSYQLSVIIGIILIVLARGIRFRVHRAYQLTVVMLLAGAIFTFAKAFDYEEALFLLIVALLLWISRVRFYREAAPFSWKTGFLLGVLTLCFVGIYLIVGLHIHPVPMKYIPHALRERFYFQPNELVTAGIVGLIGAWIFLTMWVILRPKRGVGNEPGEAELEKVETFLQSNRGNVLTHLIFLLDKNLYWALDGVMLIPYARVRDKLVALGDPLGPAERVREAIVEFQQFADRYALNAVFYQVGPSYLPVYHETGYRFFKQGEEAFVDLTTFSLKGKSKTNFRTARNRLEREGFQFEVLDPPYSDAFLQELGKVSDCWLGDRKEKAFSLGHFDESYLQRAPIAIIRNPDGKVIAFASLMPAYSGDEVISIDLMRHLGDIPNGTMDVLFTRLFDWAKEKGYRQFNLGMAPFANVGHTSQALREEKMAHLVFQYGSHWYGFEGLRRYKEKFSPNWEPRYLAYPSTVSLPLLMVDLMKLVSRKK